VISPPKPQVTEENDDGQDTSAAHRRIGLTLIFGTPESNAIDRTSEVVEMKRSIFSSRVMPRQCPQESFGMEILSIVNLRAE